METPEHDPLRGTQELLGIGKTGTGAVPVLETECSPRLNALLETMTVFERQELLNEVSRWGLLMLEDIRQGKVLSFTPFHSWMVNVQQHELALLATRRASGVVRIEAMLLEEQFERMTPESILRMLFEMAEPANPFEEMAAATDDAKDTAQLLQAGQVFDQLSQLAEEVLFEEDLDEADVLGLGVHYFRVATERQAATGCDAIDQGEDGFLVVPLYWVAADQLHSCAAAREAIGPDRFGKFHAEVSRLAGAPNARARLSAFADDPERFLREVA